MSMETVAPPQQRTGRGPRSRAVRDGMRDGTAIMSAYIPFALAAGAALTATRVDPIAAWSSSWLIFAGAAQLVAAHLLDDGSGGAVVILTALVVNARHLLYSASLAPHVRDWPRRYRWFGAYFLADPVYARAINRYEGPGGGGTTSLRLRYYVALAATCWAGWQLLTAAGAVLAGTLPAWLPLQLAAPLTFLLLLLPMLKDRASYTAAAVGGSTALIASGLPLGLGLLLGAACGIAAGASVGARHA
jgi:predicted branched-subunit amino acid permease